MEGFFVCEIGRGNYGCLMINIEYTKKVNFVNKKSLKC